MTDEIRGRCPDSVVSSLKLYVDRGVPTGSFLRSVLENNLSQSFAHADHINRHLLFEIVSHVYWEVPAGAWGSPAKVDAWLRRHADMRLENEFVGLNDDALEALRARSNNPLYVGMCESEQARRAALTNEEVTHED